MDATSASLSRSVGQASRSPASNSERVTVRFPCVSQIWNTPCSARLCQSIARMRGAGSSVPPIETPTAGVGSMTTEAMSGSGTITPAPFNASTTWYQLAAPLLPPAPFKASGYRYWMAAATAGAASSTPPRRVRSRLRRLALASPARGVAASAARFDSQSNRDWTRAWTPRAALGLVPTIRNLSRLIPYTYFDPHERRAERNELASRAESPTSAWASSSPRSSYAVSRLIGRPTPSRQRAPLRIVRTNTGISSSVNVISSASAASPQGAGGSSGSVGRSACIKSARETVLLFSASRRSKIASNCSRVLLSKRHTPCLTTPPSPRMLRTLWFVRTALMTSVRLSTPSPFLSMSLKACSIMPGVTSEWKRCRASASRDVRRAVRSSCSRRVDSSSEVSPRFHSASPDPCPAPGRYTGSRHGCSTVGVRGGLFGDCGGSTRSAAGKCSRGVACSSISSRKRASRVACSSILSRYTGTDSLSSRGDEAAVAFRIGSGAR